MNRGFSINFVQNFQQIPPVECHLRVFLNTTCWGNKIKNWNLVAVPFVSLWLTRPTCTWGTVSGKISYFGFYSVRSGCCVHLLSPRSLRCLMQLKYISIICFQSLNCSFLFFVSLCTNRSTGWNFDTNQDDLSVFASERFPRQRRKDSISPRASDQIAKHGSYPVWEKSSPLAGSCVLSLLHAAINSSSSQAGDCSHFPPLPLQPSLHDNGDLKHWAGERYDMCAAC